MHITPHSNSLPCCPFSAPISLACSGVMLGMQTSRNGLLAGFSAHITEHGIGSTPYAARGLGGPLLTNPVYVRFTQCPFLIFTRVVYHMYVPALPSFPPLTSSAPALAQVPNTPAMSEYRLTGPAPALAQVPNTPGLSEYRLSVRIRTNESKRDRE